MNQSSLIRSSRIKIHGIKDIKILGIQDIKIPGPKDIKILGIQDIKMVLIEVDTETQILEITVMVIKILSTIVTMTIEILEVMGIDMATPGLINGINHMEDPMNQKQKDRGEDAYFSKLFSEEPFIKHWWAAYLSSFSLVSSSKTVLLVLTILTIQIIPTIQPTIAWGASV